LSFLNLPTTRVVAQISPFGLSTAGRIRKGADDHNGGSGATVNKYDVTVRAPSRQNPGRATIGR
jgi:hypothetical protein